MASGYFTEWLPSIDRALATAEEQTLKGENDLGWRKDAAFTLHQAAERAYTCFLLVRSHYVPRSHNLKFLRSLAEDRETRLVEAWPRATKVDRRRFELAKRAYVEARYSAAYDIGRSEEHTSELQSLMRISYAVFCLKKKTILETYTNR